ncbi:Oxidoreductase [Coemansia erecta]|uniref:Mitochondrial intermembrane space import and assembly protein 40 n=1 Tax=Coemansia erecta TaxID=147472 RepID=A0A9W7Y1C2_9FUNG|nr:Oxidoreductase [Coemansia erecta]
MSSLEKEHEQAQLADTQIDTADLESSSSGGDGGMEDAQAQAFNPDTGEINWDCPCLGGMAQGPCGEQFKAAFSCFVYSEEEPKGMDCIDAFKAMQECFKEHPDVYADELADEDDEDTDEDVGNVTENDSASDTEDEGDKK